MLHARLLLRHGDELRPDHRRVLATLLAAFTICGGTGGPAPVVADQHQPLAVTHVRIVTGDGRTIDDGTILIQDGRIVALGRDVAVPDYVEVLDAAGHVAYPGFIDAHTHLGIPKMQGIEARRYRVEYEHPYPRQGPLAQTPAASRRGIRPEVHADDTYAPSGGQLEQHRRAGFTTALVAPRSGILAGSSLLVDLSDAPLGWSILGPDVAQHAAFIIGEPGDYPQAAPDIIAQFRQVMYDARWYAQAHKYAKRHPRTADRPPFDRALEALRPVLAGEVLLIFEADSEAQIHRVLDLAEEFNLANVVISGAAEAWRVVDRLKARRLPVIVSLKFPGEPANPAADQERIYEPSRLRRERHRLWEERVANVIRLHEAGVGFALSTRELDEPGELLDNLRLVIERGLPEEAALAALTRRPAELFGLGKQIGTIAPGRFANLTIMDQPIAAEEAKVRWVVIDGYKFDLDTKTDTAKAEPTDAKDAPPDTATERAVDAAVAEDTGPDWRCEIESDRIRGTRTGGNVLIRGATVVPVIGQTLVDASVLVVDGRIQAVGDVVDMPEDVTVIDAAGWYVMPGIVDAHWHVSADCADEPAPAVSAEVRIGDVLHTRSISMYRALAGGVTTALILHGSADPIGGQGQVIKLKYGRPVSEMPVADAPPTIELALNGDPTEADLQTNVGRQFPDTRMGVEAVLRRSLTAGRHYAEQQADQQAGVAAGQDVPPWRTDLRLQTLTEVLAGTRRAHCHCYRADDILRLIAVAEDFGFRIGCLHHALEGYRVAPEITRHGCGASASASDWAYKLEAYDAIPHNTALMTEHGICTSVTSNSPDIMRYLQLEAAKCIKWGGLNENQALRLITINPARQLGLDHRVGSIEVGKDADLALFNGHPLNAFSKCVMTFVEGELYFQADDPAPAPALRNPQSAIADPQSPLAMPSLPSNVSREVPDTPYRLYAIVGGTVHPISSPPIAEGTVVIENDVIRSVGRDVPVPPGAGVIEAKGLHVYPGLIDAGSRLGLREIGRITSTRDHDDEPDFASDLRISHAIDPYSVHIPIARTTGITTAVVQPGGACVAGQSAVIHLNGWTVPEMLVEDPWALHVSIPVLPIHIAGKDKKKRIEEHEKKMRALEEFLAKARRYTERVAAADDDPTLAPKPDLTLEAMGPYLRGQRPVVFRASSYKEILQTIEFAEKHDLRCIISGGAEAWKLADELAKKRIPVILAPTTTLPRDEFEPWDSVYSCAAVLDAAGVEFCFASQSAAGAYDLPLYAGLAVAHGLDPERAEYALTLGAATILDLDARTGSIEPGKCADLIVTTHSPLQTGCQVTHMFINGRPIDLTDNEHTRNYDHFKNRPVPNLPPPEELLGLPSLTQ